MNLQIQHIINNLYQAADMYDGKSNPRNLRSAADMIKILSNEVDKLKNELDEIKKMSK